MISELANKRVGLSDERCSNILCALDAERVHSVGLKEPGLSWFNLVYINFGLF